MDKVLIVEDEKLIRQGIKTMVSRSGVPVKEIIECNNGEAALEILKTTDIDVMFTDIQMPVMDGITLVKNINELNLLNPPAIAAISGYDDFDYAVSMMRNGVKEYLLKPVDRKKITEFLQKKEEEINLKNKDFEERKKIAFQQLQYMILFDSIEGEEIIRITDTLAEFLPMKEYVVICTNYQDNDLDIDGKVYFFTARDYMNFFVVDLSAKYDLIDELRSYCLGISHIYTNLRDLRQAYYEATAMRKTAFGTGEHIVDNEFYQVVTPTQYGIKYMMQTANLICSGKVEEAIDMLESFVKNVGDRKYSVEEFEEQIKIILTTTINMYKNNLKTTEDDIMDLLSIYRYQTINEYMQVIKEWISKFDQLIDDDDDESKNYIKIQNAIEYIKNNYSSDLNMAVVSNYVSMNYSLFSFTFKKYTGTNFVNYLKDVRIGEAKKLLQQTDMKIVEISTRVGYEHEKHFTRTFKTITGLTPSQYRNSFL
ncbi:MAG: response regulator [Lachnospiraceae bacterium]|nr:response regulator [Lachnospiraceae bacterium]